MKVELGSPQKSLLHAAFKVLVWQSVRLLSRDVLCEDIVWNGFEIFLRSERRNKISDVFCDRQVKLLLKIGKKKIDNFQIDIFWYAIH